MKINIRIAPKNLSGGCFFPTKTPILYEVCNVKPKLTEFPGIGDFRFQMRDEWGAQGAEPKAKS